jgi:hypothetical protein
MNHTLAGFQDGFVQAMRGEDGPMRAIASQPGFAVYRNTWMKACIDAIEANFPAVACLVGQEWMRSAAAAFALEHMPMNGCLANYGKTFPDFLATSAATTELAYLGEVARLDWLFLACGNAADACTLHAGQLAAFSASGLASRYLRPHPTARWHASPLPARTIWEASRSGRAVTGDLAWMPEATLMLRTEGQVRVHAIGARSCALLDACHAGHALGVALDFAMSTGDATSMDADLLHLVAIGAFADASPSLTKDTP